MIDYKAINEICLQKNIIHSYQINLPESTWTENWRTSNWIRKKHIYIVTENKKPVFIIDNKRVEADSLSKIFLDWKNSDFMLQRFPICKLYISQEQKMSVVNKLKTELSQNGIHQIAYAVIPTQIEYDKRYYSTEEIRMYIPDITEENIVDHYNKAYLFSNIIEVEIYNEILILNKKSLSAEDLKSQIKKSIIENSDYIFKHIINDNNSFAEYIKVHSLLREAIGELRDGYAFLKYGEKWDDILDIDSMEKVREKYPLRIIEVTKELTDLIEKNI